MTNADDQVRNEFLKNHGAGFIILSDIVDFLSEENGAETQKAQVEKLWYFTKTHLFLKSAGDQASYNSTGDGMLTGLDRLERPIKDGAIW